MKKTLKILFSLFLITSCSSTKKYYQVKPGKELFSFRDTSGVFTLEKDIQLKKEKLVTRSRLLDKSGVELEKSIAITQFGFIAKKSLAMRPWASDFTVWLEKDSYRSQSRLDIKNKELDFTLSEKNSKKTKSFPVPSEKAFCYFSHLIECLSLTRKMPIVVSKKKVFRFVIVWDSYPHANLQYERVPNEPFSSATISYDSKQGKHHVLKLSFRGQIIFYHLDENLRFDKMFWIAQGITIERK